MKIGLYAAALACAAVLMSTMAATAQGVQSGTLRGTVSAANAGALGGATVTVASPAMQGERRVITEEHGAYALPALPPGDYVVEVTMAGMSTVRRQVTVPLGGVAELDVALDVAPVSEVVEVVGQRASTLADPTTSANYRHVEIEALATPRTLAGIASLAPGLTQNAPNAAPTEGQAQVVINGALAYDNVFMLNGVDVNDNIFGWPQNLFVEDAIEETQVLTSGISAEYGRFSGGVINAITRSGGNTLSGSYRANLANDAWSTETPYERDRNISRPSHTNVIHEATLGGPIEKDRVWFFASGRLQDLQTRGTLPYTGAVYDTTDTNRRGEIKLTATARPGHTLQASVLGNPRRQQGQPNFVGGLSTIDPAALSDKNRPNHLVTANYKGAITAKALVELQYSQQQFSTDLGGGTSSAIADSPFLSFDFTRQYNAPFFDRTDPDGRNNRQVTGSVHYFAGTHDLKGGIEWFRSNKVGGNSQSSTGYVFFTDYATSGTGEPTYDADGRLMPLFIPGATQIFQYLQSRGAVLNVDTTSLYAQDHWRVNPHVSADLGVRFERVTSGATTTTQAVNAMRAVPRLGVSLDPGGDGAAVLHATYAQYSGRYSDALLSANSPVGHPIEIDGVYTGPAGQGRSFSAGFDPANYDYDGIYASFPGANIFFADGFSSPLTHEATASAGRLFGRSGSAQATYVWRRTNHLIEDYVDLTTGATTIEQAHVDMTVSNRVYRNSDTAFRTYQGLVFEGRYDLSPDWKVNGHWTVQLKNEGNYEGEGSGQITTSIAGDYPEIFTAERHYPTGRLANFQRHKVDVWSIYHLHFGRFGGGSVSGLWRYNSARVYSLRAASPLSAMQVAMLADLGYVDGPSSQSVYYSAPGSESFAGYGMLDMSVSYDVPVLRTIRPWIKLDVFNVLNNQKAISWNTSIKPDAASATDSLGIRTGYVKGPLFGHPTGTGNYPAPFAGQTGGRTVRLAVGVRF
jgi:hypothetical protein